MKNESIRTTIRFNSDKDKEVYQLADRLAKAEGETRNKMLIKLIKEGLKNYDSVNINEHNQNFDMSKESPHQENTSQDLLKGLHIGRSI